MNPMKGCFTLSLSFDLALTDTGRTYIYRKGSIYPANVRINLIYFTFLAFFFLSMVPICSCLILLWVMHPPLPLRFIYRSGAALCLSVLPVQRGIKTIAKLSNPNLEWQSLIPVHNISISLYTSGIPWAGALHSACFKLTLWSPVYWVTSLLPPFCQNIQPRSHWREWLNKTTDVAKYCRPSS